MTRFNKAVIRSLLLSGGASLVLLAHGAQAQTVTSETARPQPTGPSDSGIASDGTGVSEIIVTAQKRSERLQDVPASVAVLSTQDLTKQGAVRFEDYATRVPGLTFTSVRTGQAQVTLRGITTGAAQSASSTGYYVDEAPVGSVNAYTGGSSTTPDLDPSDLAQIEVLKGPQGTLYGAGAVGGLLKFVTAQPDFENVTGRIAGGVTSVKKGDVGYSARGMINIPLAKDELVLRVSGFDRRDSGFIDNVTPRIAKDDLNGARVRGFRGLLSAKFGPDVRLDIQAIGQDTRTDGTNSVDVDALTLRPIEGDLKQRRQVRETGFVKFRLYNATLRADLGQIGLVSSTTYQHTRLNQQADASRGLGVALGALLGIPGGIGLRANQTTYSARWVQELRATGRNLANGLFDAQLGFYYTHEDDSNRVPRYDPLLPSTGAALPLPNIITASILSKYEEYSVFGNVTLHLGDRFDVLGGIRYSNDKQDYAQDYSGLLVGGRRINTGDEKANIFTYLVSPRFKINPDMMIYGRVSTGYRPGGPNAVPPPSVFPDAPLQFNPDKLTSYEIGYKASFMDRKVTLDAALFYTDWKDIQIQTSAGGFNFFVNGGSARSKGGEVTLRVMPTRGLLLGLNAGYTLAKLASDAPAAGGVDGDRLPYVPKVQGSLTGEYKTPAFGDFDATIGGAVNHTSSRESDYSNRFSKRLPAYTTFDLRAGIEDKRFSLSVFAKNIGDKRGVLVLAQQGLAPSATAGQVYGAAVIQPRTIGAEAALRF
jgi:outer membrane receptor protein involved in Fe transport